MFNELNLKTAVLGMMADSGFLAAATLTPADAELRISVDPTELATVNFDASAVEEHLEILTDYAALAGPINLKVQLDPSMDSNNVLSLRARPLDQETASDDEDDTDLEDEIYDEDDDDGEALDDEEDVEDADGEVPAVNRGRGDKDKLLVLTTSDMHKIAGRLYGALGDTSRNMGDYVGFLRDLDALLNRYGGVPASPRESEAPVELSMLIELADAVAEETAAKKKKGKKGEYKEGRSGLLSAIMSGLSGALGEKVQKLWDNLKAEDFQEAMIEVVKKATAKIQAETASAETAKLPQQIAPSEPRPMICMVPVLNGPALQAWARDSGFQFSLPADDFHATIAYSKEPIDWNSVEPLVDEIQVAPNNGRTIQKLGDQGAIVLKLTDEDASVLKDRWSRYIENGASWDYDGYTPHVTISWKESFTDEDLAKMTPYSGPLTFGAELQSEIKQDFDPNGIQHVPLTSGA